MIRKSLYSSLLVALFYLSACATPPPSGPGVMVLPTPGKSFDQFRREDAYCRNWAEQQTGLSPQAVANQSTANGAAVGTAIGVGAGALLGAASGNAGAGAAIGGISGMMIGASSGANAGQVYGYEAQRRYDIAYLQCMYAYGNQVPSRKPYQQPVYKRKYIPPPPPFSHAPYYDKTIPPPPPGATPQTPPELLENRSWPE